MSGGIYVLCACLFTCKRFRQGGGGGGGRLIERREVCVVRVCACVRVWQRFDRGTQKVNGDLGR